MNKDILVIGKGFIGERIQQEFDCAISDKIIISYADAQGEVDKFRPKVMINCAGYTGKNNVDECELDKDATLQGNTLLPIILAEVALRNNIKLVHISSGCIYHYDYAKQKPVKEEDPADSFELFYSRSKIYSELALERLSTQYNILIVRIRIPLDNRSHPRSILNKLLKYKKAIDIPNSITYIPDFIKALKHLIDTDAKGLFNVTSKGALRYKELLDVYKRYKPDFSYEMVELKDVLKTPRTNLIMDVSKLERAGFAMREVHEVLDEAVRGVLQ